MPIEVMAARGAKTMLLVHLKPVGLEDPHTGKTPYAVVQCAKIMLQLQCIILLVSKLI